MLLRLLLLATIAVGINVVFLPIARAEAPKFEGGDYDLQFTVNRRGNPEPKDVESVIVEISAEGVFTLKSKESPTRKPLKGKLVDGKLLIDFVEGGKSLHLEGTVTKPNEITGEVNSKDDDGASQLLGTFRLTKTVE